MILQVLQQHMFFFRLTGYLGDDKLTMVVFRHPTRGSLQVSTPQQFPNII